MSSSYHASTVEQLGQRLAAGQFPPGSALKVEADLCQELGVSRTILREAIKTLAAKGMLEVGPKVGTRVLPLSRWNLFDTQVVGWLATAVCPPISSRTCWICVTPSSRRRCAGPAKGPLPSRSRRSRSPTSTWKRRSMAATTTPPTSASTNASWRPATISSSSRWYPPWARCWQPPSPCRRPIPTNCGVPSPCTRPWADGIASRDAARAVWACMMLIDSAAVTLARYTD